jgi:nucleotide-binding universal stress UspA family protein
VRCTQPDAVPHEILEVARTLPADFVVLGSRGRRPLAELLLGSVSHEVVAGASCPVLVVRSARYLAHKGVRKILLAIEGDAESDALFMATAGPALGLKAEVEVVHMYYPGQEDFERDLHRARLSHGEQAIADISARLRRAGVEVTTRRLTGQSGAARELAREADAEDAGLIVMGSGRMTRLVDRLVGSVAEGVLHRTRRPVLLAKVPPAVG